jgi:hypothetical protein
LSQCEWKVSKTRVRYQILKVVDAQQSWNYFCSCVALRLCKDLQLRNKVEESDEIDEIQIQRIWVSLSSYAYYVSVNHNIIRIL